MGVNAHSQSAAVAHRYGGHSMTAPLRSVMVRRPRTWDRMGSVWVRSSDRSGAGGTRARHFAKLAANGIEVVEDGPDDEQLDAIFTFDPSIMTDAVRSFCGWARSFGATKARFMPGRTKSLASRFSAESKRLAPSKAAMRCG